MIIKGHWYAKSIERDREREKRARPNFVDYK